MHTPHMHVQAHYSLGLIPGLCGHSHLCDKGQEAHRQGVLEKLSLLVFTIRGGWDRDQPLAVVLVTQMCLVMGKMACQPVDLVCAHETPKLP